MWQWLKAREIAVYVNHMVAIGYNDKFRMFGWEGEERKKRRRKEEGEEQGRKKGLQVEEKKRRRREKRRGRSCSGLWQLWLGKKKRKEEEEKKKEEKGLHPSASVTGNVSVRRKEREEEEKGKRGRIRRREKRGEKKKERKGVASCGCGCGNCSWERRKGGEEEEELRLRLDWQRKLALPVRRGDRPWPGYLQGATARRGSSMQGAPPIGTASYDQPARGCRPRLALPPVGAVAPFAGVAAPWQGSYRSQRAAAAYVRAATMAAQ
ncbi:hypothetical protein B296_00046346 [Ensete ventricosum]|uniref:Uncharacterized protein n=1 Tax=Ensete ventricosum TaxID=4639 RepID=A0A426XH60_ENSVE|nr:hypothetical protein B296_00046346 [Ensete ventricosum]